MSSNSDLSAEDLPPKPDPVTGLPRPPRAPSSKIELWPKDRNPFTGRPHAPRKPSLLRSPAAATITPPEGQGPLLEYHRHDYKREVGLLVFLLVAYSGVIALLLATRPEHRAPWWLVGGIFMALAAISIHQVRGSDCAVGAEWLRTAHGDWVRTYELVEFSTRFRGIDMALHFKDKDGRTVEINGSDLCASDDLWSLVYNGIVHSIVLNGARTTPGLRRELSLPRPRVE